MLIIKKLLSALLCAALAVSMAPAAYAQGAPETSAASAIVMHSGGQVIYEKDADRSALIASLTKVMTAIVVLENAELDEAVEIPAQCCGIEGSSMYLMCGEVYTVRQLLCGLMLVSGNDAASALAVHTAGSEEGFARLMNEKAVRLGMSGSHFVNPHGLNAEGHYSTARDMAKLMDYCMNNPCFAEISGLISCNIGGQTLVNHNKLLSSCEGCIGGKTGYTKAAGRCLVSCCERGGSRFICVTFSAPDDWNDHRKLYDWAFAGYGDRIVTEGLSFCVPVVSGERDEVWLIAEELKVFAPKSAELSLSAEMPWFVFAPVRAGERAGRLVVSLEGEEIGEAQLYYESDVNVALPANITSTTGDDLMSERLQKIISASGLMSRRAAEDRIASGRVTVNGAVARLGDRADAGRDVIAVDGTPLPSAGARLYIMLNKPRGYVTTVSDEKNRPCVTRLVQEIEERVYPVGRLDMYSEGLLILTNDGEFANRLMHPSHNFVKRYKTWVSGDIKAGSARLRRTMDIDGVQVRAVSVDTLEAGSDRGVLMIGISEGRNRQIRKMCEAAGLKVTRLQRVSEGPLELGHLKTGCWRYLSESEIGLIIK